MVMSVCLAMAIYFESRGEPDIGKYAVGEVVLNRSESTGQTVCETVFQRGQFSWTKHTRSPPKQSIDWSKSQTVAKSLLENKTDYTHGAMYFNAKRMGSRFGKKTKCVIGNHIFF